MESNCPHCNKSIPRNSAFCVHCGKELGVSPTETEEASIKENSQFKSSSARKLSSIFNIVILLAAIASIAGFMYFYVENKISTPADKSSINEEILGNLYRNTKYKFRIKFPESWEIKKGDGPNILVKATSRDGGSINIYVKDLGIEFGDIDDLISIDDWANSINENFPSAKIISKKEISIDNRKAYFVQYSVNYKVIDRQTDMILYNVGLINKNINYTITAGSEESKFQERKQILDQAVGTFVIEEYRTNINSQDQSSNFQSNNAPITKERKESKSEPTNQPWFRNSLYGVSFKTPKQLEEQPSKAPAGYEEHIEKIKTYYSKEEDLFVLFVYAETKFETYDKKEGLSSSIGNMVNGMNGTDLKLKFYELKNNFDDLKCSGSFKFQESEFKVRGYIYWNGKGKIVVLAAMGKEKDLKSMNKIIETVRINIP